MLLLLIILLMDLCNIIVELTLCDVCLSGSCLLKIGFLATWFRGHEHVLSGLLIAALRKDWFAKRQSGTTVLP